MSLRKFHLFFIMVSIGLAVFMAYWNFNEWNSFGKSSSMFYLLFSVSTAVGLLAYGIRFMKQYSSLEDN